jgi:hypothetical protein
MQMSRLIISHDLKYENNHPALECWFRPYQMGRENQPPQTRFLVKVMGCHTASDEGQTHEPAKEQVVFEALIETTLRGDSKKDLDLYHLRTEDTRAQMKARPHSA